MSGWRRGDGGYGSPLPKALRLQVLEAEPYCRVCGAPSTTVDHIQPRRRRPDLFDVRSNLQGLCKRCHDRKTGSRDSKPLAIRRREPERHPGSTPRGGENLHEPASRLSACEPARGPVRVSGVVS